MYIYFHFGMSILKLSTFVSFLNYKYTPALNHPKVKSSHEPSNYFQLHWSSNALNVEPNVASENLRICPVFFFPPTDKQFPHVHHAGLIIIVYFKFRFSIFFYLHRASLLFTIRFDVFTTGLEFLPFFFQLEITL